MKKLAVITVFVFAVILLVSCTAKVYPAQTETDAPAVTNEDEDTAEYTAPDGADKLADPADDSRAAAGDFSVTPGKDAGEVSVSGGVYTIKKAGEYTLKGNLADGQVIVDAGDKDEITLIMENASVSCSSGAPILILNAAEAAVKSAETTYNTVTDSRATDAKKDSGSADNYDAAIYADCDLKINGKGTLIVTSAYDNGIKSKDDLKIKNVTLKVTSPGCSLKGNDGVEIESGEIILTSTGSDCIKTSSTELSSKNNQKGSVTISGGHVDIYAAQDGISAACDAVISSDTEDCTVNIFTSSYADLSDGGSASSEIYLIVSGSDYSDSNDYYAYFYNDDNSDGKWSKCEYETMIRSGRSASYYGLVVKAPSSYKNVAFATVKAGVQPDGENHTAITEGEAVNTSMNGYLITDISSGLITGDWVQITSDGGGNSEKTTYSSKGIKAENDIIITGGVVSVYSKDDGMHANSGSKLESGVTSTGNITVKGGSVVITAADDGMHADGTLKINNGYVKIEKSHEGLEGNVVEINGGKVYVYGEDDGINACKGSKTALVNITGGYLDVTTPSGDTDGIDSNGSITMSGGVAVVRSGASMGGVAGSVDADGTVTVTGGTIVALGGVCEVPEGDSVNTYVSSGTSFSAGDYTVSDSAGNTVAAFSLPSSYSSFWIASDKIALNGGYKVTKDNVTVLEWTQTSTLLGYSGGGFNPGGGFGPGGGGRPGGRR
ncbi:MAG: carbohydrate-binding domain-containing protein [Clostridia bacterium]|nr:carbohydrate-binding domain-containing protein [Clostridia bacterium]